MQERRLTSLLLPGSEKGEGDHGDQYSIGKEACGNLFHEHTPFFTFFVFSASRKVAVSCLINARCFMSSSCPGDPAFWIARVSCDIVRYFCCLAQKKRFTRKLRILGTDNKKDH